MSTEISQVAAEVRDRLPVSTYAPMAGFRPASRIRAGWHCIHGQDQTPSAREYKSRIVCFACKGRWSSIDLIMTAYGCSFVDAVKIGAAELGIPWCDLPPEEAEKHRQASRNARALARDAADWLHGLGLRAEARKRILIQLWQDAAERGDQKLEEYAASQLEGLPRFALDPMSADALIQVRAYTRAVRLDPERARAIREFGRNDRWESMRLTWAIIDMLAAATDLNVPREIPI